MNRLSRDNYLEYLNKVYSSWLGKIIGIRLGAPVENWTYKKIKNIYKGKHYYLVDYNNFGSDDDSNGPLFFVRALDDKLDINEIDIGNAILNYLCEYHGFFWWGGVGISTEHTAYENLKNGIKPPYSGSKELNGLVISEQIGGQIFSDCWGYVSGYDPNLAKKLAGMASSVTHDGGGIEGGIFVSVAICLAFSYSNIVDVIRDTIKYLNKDLEYYRVVKDIYDYYLLNPDDEEGSFEYILSKYDYDKYEGVCHIIPNAALMVRAMLYGKNDFSYTLELLNNSGRDTDCNCGNVGSIMGALVGLDNIDEKWIKPINDVINCSSAIGCLNIQTVSDSANYFAKLAYKLKNIDIDFNNQFYLKYSTKGFIGDVSVSDNSLVCKGNIYKYVYYKYEDIYDARYDSEFSPLLYPNDEIVIDINGKGNISLYVVDCDGNKYSKNFYLDNREIIKYRIDTHTNMVINYFGIDTDIDYIIYDIKFNSNPKVFYDFEKYSYDVYSPTYTGGFLKNIRAFVKNNGDWFLDNGLVAEPNSIITSFGLDSLYNSIETEFSFIKGNDFYLILNMKNNGNYYYFGIKDKEIVLYRKENMDENAIFISKNICVLNNKIKLKIVLINSKILMYVNDIKVDCNLDINRLFGLLGFKTGLETSVVIHYLSVS